MAKRFPLTPWEVSQRRELRQMAAAPLADVSGVVHFGASGSKSRGEKVWSLDLQLKPWRVKGGEVQESALFVRKRPVSQKDMKRLINSIRQFSVLRLRARVVEKSAVGRPAALVKQFAGPERGDAELRRRAEELKKPVVEKDDQFGRLTLDRRMGVYSAKVKWNGRRVNLELQAEGPQELQGALKTARALWKAQAAWQKRIEKLAVKELLADKNGAWLMDDEKPLTAGQFLKRMKLESINAYPDGAVAFWHDDGDLFWGHAIQMTGNLKRGLTGVDMPG